MFPCCQNLYRCSWPDLEDETMERWRLLKVNFYKVLNQWDCGTARGIESLQRLKSWGSETVRLKEELTSTTTTTTTTNTTTTTTIAVLSAQCLRGGGLNLPEVSSGQVASLQLNNNNKIFKFPTRKSVGVVCVTQSEQARSGPESGTGCTFKSSQHTGAESVSTGTWTLQNQNQGDPNHKLISLMILSSWS